MLISGVFPKDDKLAHPPPSSQKSFVHKPTSNAVSCSLLSPFAEFGWQNEMPYDVKVLSLTLRLALLDWVKRDPVCQYGHCGWQLRALQAGVSRASVSYSNNLPFHERDCELVIIWQLTKHKNEFWWDINPIICAACLVNTLIACTVRSMTWVSNY